MRHIRNGGIIGRRVCTVLTAHFPKLFDGSGRFSETNEEIKTRRSGCADVGAPQTLTLSLDRQPAKLSDLLRALRRSKEKIQTTLTRHRLTKLERSQDDGSPCYKFLMPKIAEQWLLFKYIDSELTPLSKPLKTKEQAERVRLRCRERERKTIGIGVIRTKS